MFFWGFLLFRFSRLLHCWEACLKLVAGQSGLVYGRAFVRERPGIRRYTWRGRGWRRNEHKYTKNINHTIQNKAVVWLCFFHIRFTANKEQPHAPTSTYLVWVDQKLRNTAPISTNCDTQTISLFSFLFPAHACTCARLIRFACNMSV